MSSNADILQKIGNSPITFQAIATCLDRLTGRFVLVAVTKDGSWIFHDPCGLRTVYYTGSGRDFHAASQPTLLAQAVPLEASAHFSEYMDSDYRRSVLEHWLPSGHSLARNVSHLVPNHAVSLHSGTQIRYWPNAPIRPVSLDRGAREASDLLSKIISAADHRFKLALPMTAGLDSRMLLAAAKHKADRLYCYTLQYRDLTATSDDIRIPRELLRSLGIDHRIIDCRQSDLPDDFLELYRQNGHVPVAHLNDWGFIAYGLHTGYPQTRVALKGNCSEIARCYYYPFGRHRRISSVNQLLDLEPGWRELPFVREQIAEWLKSVRGITVQMGVDILDLFYWEHRMGSWQAQSQLEWDVAQESFTPFNHRGLLETMLGVPAKFRCAPSYRLQRQMISTLWPELLRVPINPKSRAALFKYRLKHVLDSAGVLGSARRVAFTLRAAQRRRDS